MWKCGLGLVLLVCASTVAQSHPGRTDASGCHHDRRSGGYHCHGGRGGGGGSDDDEPPATKYGQVTIYTSPGATISVDEKPVTRFKSDKISKQFPDRRMVVLRKLEQGWHTVEVKSVERVSSYRVNVAERHFILADLRSGPASDSFPAALAASAMTTALDRAVAACAAENDAGNVEALLTIRDGQVVGLPEPYGSSQRHFLVCVNREVAFPAASTGDYYPLTFSTTLRPDPTRKHQVVAVSGSSDGDGCSSTWAWIIALFFLGSLFSKKRRR